MYRARTFIGLRRGPGSRPDCKLRCRAGAAGHPGLSHRARAARRRSTTRVGATVEPVSAALGRAAASGGGEPPGRRAPEDRQADRVRARGRPVPGAAPDGLGPAALEKARGEGRRPRGARGVRLPRRRARALRGLDEEAGLAPSRRGRGGARGARPRGDRGARSGPRPVPRGVDAREPYGQALADGPAPVLRHRQRLFRRDPAPREDVSREADAENVRRGDRPAVRGRAGSPRRVGGPPLGRSLPRVPRARDGLPRRDGGPRPLRETVSGLRLAGAAHRLCRERVELLRDLPDRRQAARGSGPLAAPPRRLAEDARGARGA